jgi:hypothetical protein
MFTPLLSAIQDDDKQLRFLLLVVSRCQDSEQDGGTFSCVMVFVFSKFFLMSHPKFQTSVRVTRC